MRLLFASLLGLMAAVGAAFLFTRDSGRVVLSYGEWTVQTSFSFFLVALLLLLLAAWFLYSLLLGMLRLPRNLRLWSGARRQQRADRMLARGLEAMIEGDWREAERAFRQGARLGREPVLNYLWAARAAEQQGSAERAERWLELAAAHAAPGAHAVELVRAELQLAAGQPEQAWTTLELLESRQPGQPRTERLLLDTALRRRDWTAALRRLQLLEAGRQLPAERVHELKIRIHAGLLQAAGTPARREALEEAWRQVPGRLQHEPELIEVYVRERLRHPGHEDLEPLLRRAIERQWQPKLVRLYGLIETADAARQLRRAEGWLEAQRQDAALQLALGRLCRRSQLWGKARGYLDESIRLRPQAEAWRELAALHEQQGEQAAAAACYQQGLKLLLEEKAVARNS